MPTPCDHLYESGVDYVYVPRNRTKGNYRKLMELMHNVGFFYHNLFDECLDSGLHLLCHFYLPPCGNSTHFEPPAAVCPSACRIPSLECPDEWARVVNVFQDNDAIINAEGLYLINCSDTGEHLHPVPHCCHNAGINTRKQC